MNAPRLFLALIAGVVFILGSDFLLHTSWLQADYRAMPSMFRTASEVQRRFLFMIASQLLTVIAFLYIWAKTGWRRRSVVDGCVFGFWMAAWQQALTIAVYVVMPVSAMFMLKLFCAGIAQGVCLGALGALIYKPRALTSRAGG